MTRPVLRQPIEVIVEGPLKAGPVAHRRLAGAVWPACLAKHACDEGRACQCALPDYRSVGGTWAESHGVDLCTAKPCFGGAA